MKKLMLICMSLFLFLMIGCDQYHQAPELYYSNVSGVIKKIEPMKLDIQDIRVGSNYDFNSKTPVYFICLSNDSTLYTQLHQYNWDYTQCNLYSKKQGDSVYFQYIKKNRFYKVK